MFFYVDTCLFFSAALRNIVVGGTVIYSTCSLSPIQNDGVVKMALKKIWEETDHQIVIKYVCCLF